MADYFHYNLLDLKNRAGRVRCSLVQIRRIGEYAVRTLEAFRCSSTAATF